MKNNNIIDRVAKQLSNMEKLSKLIIVYGTLISILLFVFSGIVYYCNNIFINSNALMNNCIALMKASVNIFAEVIIGSLVMDNILKTNVS
ncbi:MAG: hypothetical protein ACM3KR_08510 [Deltaproteobacteria bacterium]